MSQLFFKISKTALGILISLLFVSNGAIEVSSDIVVNNPGTYSLTVGGDLNRDITGVVTFESSVETKKNSTSFSTLKLNFKKDYNEHQALGFLISKEGTNEGVDAGVYEITKDIDGFLNRFDGVFGFANIDRENEEPFFAETGRIRIYRNYENVVVGTITVMFKNSNQRKITLEGDFTAIKI